MFEWVLANPDNSQHVAVPFAGVVEACITVPCAGTVVRLLVLA